LLSKTSKQPYIIIQLKLVWLMYWNITRNLMSFVFVDFYILLKFGTLEFFCYFDRNQVLVMTDVSFGRCQTSVSFCFGFSLFRGFYSSLSGPKTECLFVLFALLKSRFCNLRGVIICLAKKRQTITWSNFTWSKLSFFSWSKFH
jgi:hypothetical protein